jgi:hypothetical protein
MLVVVSCRYFQLCHITLSSYTALITPTLVCLLTVLAVSIRSSCTVPTPVPPIGPMHTPASMSANSGPLFLAQLNLWWPHNLYHEVGRSFHSKERHQGIFSIRISFNVLTYLISTTMRVYTPTR